MSAQAGVVAGLWGCQRCKSGGATLSPLQPETRSAGISSPWFVGAATRPAALGAYVQHGSTAAELVIAAAVNNAPYVDQRQRGSAHDARFTRHIQPTPGEVQLRGFALPAPQHLIDCLKLRMPRPVSGGVGHVVPTPNDAAISIRDNAPTTGRREGYSGGSANSACSSASRISRTSASVHDSPTSSASGPAITVSGCESGCLGARSDLTCGR
eukprot:CAMPEP_0177768800 /NCGR_PEP_ID=MMETSP0491_2-20121128/9934_1 /TAXON_ID=63592 /ORGANISM="Tetraselmis chuii, Strain PLY429" /LENGTH=211 /DNA_ID=CAMNT_0019285671 /DNA_START=277 /DNA_END=910 /DNA_ORIENTATION=+